MGERRDREQVLVPRGARERAVARVAELERHHLAGIDRGHRREVRMPAVVAARRALVEAPRAVDLYPRAPPSEPLTGCEPYRAVRAADHVEHDLVRAGADAVQAHVAPRALDAVLLHVAGAAVDLEALVGHLARDPRGVELGHRDLAHRVLAVLEAPGGASRPSGGPPRSSWPCRRTCGGSPGTCRSAGRRRCGRWRTRACGRSSAGRRPRSRPRRSAARPGAPT